MDTYAIPINASVKMHQTLYHDEKFRIATISSHLFFNLIWPGERVKTNNYGDNALFTVLSRNASLSWTFEEIANPLINRLHDPGRSLLTRRFTPPPPFCSIVSDSQRLYLIQVI